MQLKEFGPGVDEMPYRIVDVTVSLQLEPALHVGFSDIRLHGFKDINVNLD